MFLKTIFARNNRGKTILYILFAVSILSFATFLFYSQLLPQSISLLALILTLIGMMFFGGLIIQRRSGPPW